MFAYCNNNPVMGLDLSGTANVHFSMRMYEREYASSSPPQTPAEQTEGIINGQGSLPYADQRIGLGSYGRTGCQYIAVYNAMQLIGDPQPLDKVTAEVFWNGAVAFGAGGAGPWAVSAYFDAHGIGYTGASNANVLAANIADGSVLVFTVMYSTGWHAMSAVYSNGTYTVFNRYDNSSEPKIYVSLNEICANGWWIYGLRIDP